MKLERRLIETEKVVKYCEHWTKKQQTTYHIYANIIKRNVFNRRKNI